MLGIDIELEKNTLPLEFLHTPNILINSKIPLNIENAVNDAIQWHVYHNNFNYRALLSNLGQSQSPRTTNLSLSLYQHFTEQATDYILVEANIQTDDAIIQTKHVAGELYHSNLGNLNRTKELIQGPNSTHWIELLSIYAKQIETPFLKLDDEDDVHLIRTIDDLHNKLQTYIQETMQHIGGGCSVEDHVSPQLIRVSKEWVSKFGEKNIKNYLHTQSNAPNETYKMCSISKVYPTPTLSISHVPLDIISNDLTNDFLL